MYTGIDKRELDEVRRLNERFLYALRRPRSAAKAGLASVLDSEELTWLESASADEIGDLAETPFFLFRLDDAPTELSPNVTTRLFSPNEANEDEVLLMGLSFCWQLARRAAFPTRVLTGARADWCQWLATVPFAVLAEVVRVNPNPLTPNLMEAKFFWPGLVGAVRNCRHRHVAAIKSAGLQHLLKRQHSDNAMPLAARTLTVPGRRVADGDSSAGG